MSQIANNLNEKTCKFSSQHLLAMLRDILNDYKDLKNKILKKLFIYDLSQNSYALEIIEAKVELLIHLLNLSSWVEIKKEYNLPEKTDFKSSAEEAFGLLQSLINRRKEIKDKFISVKVLIDIERLKLEDYQNLSKIYLLSYVLDIRDYDFDLNKLK